MFVLKCSPVIIMVFPGISCKARNQGTDFTALIILKIKKFAIKSREKIEEKRNDPPLRKSPLPIWNPLMAYPTTMKCYLTNDDFFFLTILFYIYSSSSFSYLIVFLCTFVFNKQHNPMELKTSKRT